MAGRTFYQAPGKRSGPWLVHTPNLFKEVLSNNGTGILAVPLQITANILHDVAERAIQLNDPILNHLMCRLTLYEVADPTSDAYDPEVLGTVQELAKEAYKNL